MRSSNRLLLLAAFLALVVPQRAPAQYLTDGTKPVSGGVNTPGATTYSNPKDGVCVVGVQADGTLRVANAVTNFQACNVYTSGLTGMTTQAACTVVGAAGNDGARHRWGTSLCVNGSGVPISRANLDVTASMCTALGGTIQAAGPCVAYGWTYMNSKSGEAIPHRSTITVPATYEGRADADKLGFCYATMRMTTVTGYNSNVPGTPDGCPAYHNNAVAAQGGTPTTGAVTGSPLTTLTLTHGGTTTSPNIQIGWTVTIAGAGPAALGGGNLPHTTTVAGVSTAGKVFTLTVPATVAVTGATVLAYRVPAEWPLGTDNMPYQTKASYDAGLGWSWASSQCLYSYGRKGYSSGILASINLAGATTGDTVAPTTGTTTASSANLTGVPSNAGLVAGAALIVVGAGLSGANLSTTVVSVSGSGPYTVVMANTASTAVSNTTVQIGALVNVASITGLAVNQPVIVQGAAASGLNLSTTIVGILGAGPYTLALAAVAPTTVTGTNVTAMQPTATTGNWVDMTLYTTQGDCLANGGSWDAWLPYDQSNPTRPGATTASLATAPLASTIVQLDADTPVLSPGGGDFYTGTGSVCQKCHSDQSRGYMERYKPGYVLTGHKLAGDDPAFQPAIGAEWGVKGVQCTTCHATGKPALQDKGLVVYPNTTGANAGLPRAATGHTQLDLGSHVTGICYKCHGTPTVPDTLNPAAVIPTSGGEFAKTAYNLAPLVNQFLASSHAKYSGANAKGRTVDVITKSNYGSTFVGYACKTGSGAVLTSWVDKGVPARIPNLDSATNIYCTGSSTPQPDGTAYAGGLWDRDGEAAGKSNGVDFDASDQGSCMTCHDVHWSKNDHNTYDGLHPEPFRRECTTCHENPGTSASGAMQIDLAAINHSAAAGTPLTGTADEACETCHMPKLTSAGSFLHLWAISTNAAYTTAGASTANADTDGTIKVDLDAACGQCHGGGMNAVANPPKPGIPYYTRAALAVVAKGMHASAGNNYQVTFSNVVSGLSVTPTASVNCGAGVTCPAFTYDWSWGDGTTTLAQLTVTPAPHVYAAAGSFSITLTVKLVSNGLSVGSVTRTVNLTSADAPPTAAGTFTWDANSWTATLVDASTDDKTLPADLAVVVEWGDGTRSAGRANGTFSHVYLKPPAAPATSYAITQSVVDTKPQKTTRTYGPVIPAYFTIGGTVTARLGAALSGATVLVRRGSVYSRTLTTDGAGAFTVGNLVPGVYTLKVTKFGYTFINPIAIPAIGPSNTTVVVAASAP